MANFTIYKGTKIGVGDKIKITQKIKEKEKERLQHFDGMIIAIKGKEQNKTITVRKIGELQIGIEKIFPLISPSIVSIEVLKKGMSGSKHAKLYFLRNKSKKDLSKIYSRVPAKSK